MGIRKNLYEYIKEQIQRSNQEYGIKVTDVAPMVRTGEEQDYATSGDCVARCVGYISKALGLSNISYEYANSIISSEYGNNGVPINELKEVLGGLYGADRVSSYQLPVGEYIYSAANSKVLIGILNQDGTGHAVIYQATDDDNNIIYLDPQRGNLPYFTSINNVIASYRVSKN